MGTEEVKRLNALAFLVRGAQEQYWQIDFELRNMQYGLVKQYLWLAALIASGAFALWTSPLEGIRLPPFIVCGLALCLLSSLVSFVLALLCLKSKGMDDPPYDRDWKDFANNLYEEYTLESIQYNMLQTLSAAIQNAQHIMTSRALRLRWSCRLLLFSSIVLIITVALYGWILHYG